MIRAVCWSEHAPELRCFESSIALTAEEIGANEGPLNRNVGEFFLFLKFDFNSFGLFPGYYRIYLLTRAVVLPSVLLAVPFAVLVEMLSVPCLFGSGVARACVYLKPQQ